MVQPPDTNTRAEWINQIHAAGGACGFTTMMMVFVR